MVHGEDDLLDMIECNNMLSSIMLENIILCMTENDKTGVQRNRHALRKTTETFEFWCIEYGPLK